MSVDEKTLLDALYVIALILSSVLLLGSSAMASRHITDLEYQQITSTNGIRRIESYTGLRTHINRIVLAFTFILISVMGLTNVDMMIRVWVSRTFIIVTLFGFTISCIADWNAERMKLKIFIKDRVKNESEDKNTKFDHVDTSVRSESGFDAH